MHAGRLARIWTVLNRDISRLLEMSSKKGTHIAELLGAIVQPAFEADVDAAQIHGVLHDLAVFWIHIGVHRRCKDHYILAQVLLHLNQHLAALGNKISTTPRRASQRIPVPCARPGHVNMRTAL